MFCVNDYFLAYEESNEHEHLTLIRNEDSPGEVFTHYLYISFLDEYRVYYDFDYYNICLIGSKVLR